jgi:transcriptional regulator with XRE-family HTH domain
MSDSVSSIRFKKIRNHLGNLTQQELASALGIGRGTIATIENGRSKPSYDVIEALVTILGVNPDYLVTGEEPVLLRDRLLHPAMSNRNSVGASYLVPVSIQAGYAEEWPQGRPHLDMVIIPGLPRSGGMVFEVDGESMSPVLLHGDYIGCTQLQSESEIRDGLLYAIVTVTRGITVKYIRMGQEVMHCYPENIGEFQSFDLPLSEVKEVWEVHLRVTKNLTTHRFTKKQVYDDPRVKRLERMVEILMQQLAEKAD